jgi:acyl-coenzyme A synthetase/AMP-(fatty) acid ligase
VVAFVILQPGAQLSEAEVLALLEDRIARYKHPREIRFANGFPRTALGKVMRAELVKAVSVTAGA